MNTPLFATLTSRQQNVLLIAMVLRTALEDFHVSHLTNPQIKELNQILRYAVDDAFEVIATMKSDPTQRALLSWLISRIPEYWEIPGRDPRPVVSRPFSDESLGHTL